LDQIGPMNVAMSAVVVPPHQQDAGLRTGQHVPPPFFVQSNFPAVQPQSLHVGGGRHATLGVVVAIVAARKSHDARVSCRRWFRGSLVGSSRRFVCGGRRFMSTAAAADGQTDTSFADLASWLRERGSYVSDVISLVDSDPLASKGGERGCVASRAVEQGELLLELPLACCMAPAPGMEAALEPVANDLAAAGVDPKDAALAVALAEERSLGGSSAWWPYVRLVGEPIRTFPCFFQDEDLLALQSPPLAESLAATVRAIERTASWRGLERDALLSAWQLMASRRFGCEQGRYMLPLGDLLNHSFEPSCGWERPEQSGKAAWRLVALKRLGSGEVLNFEYCKDPNHLLLSTSGFVVPGNPFNRIMARPAELRESLAAVANPRSAADFARWRCAEFERQLPDPETPSPGLSMYILGKVPGGVQWNPLWLDLCGLAVSASSGTHWSREPGGIEAYCQTVERATSGLFTTTIGDDKAALESGRLSANGTLAAQFLLGQKQLVEEAVASLRQRMLSTQA